MKKTLTIAILILFPINVYAQDLFIECNDILLENNKETECQIKATNLSFNVTNITGKIVVSNNLQIVSSSYDDSIWKIFDKKFSVEDINLISENKHNGNHFIIANFKIKSNNKQNEEGKIQFINIELGDDNYEGHKVENQHLNINLIYDSENEKTNNNEIKNIIIIIITISIFVFLGYKNKKITK